MCVFPRLASDRHGYFGLVHRRPVPTWPGDFLALPWVLFLKSNAVIAGFFVPKMFAVSIAWRRLPLSEDMRTLFSRTQGHSEGRAGWLLNRKGCWFDPRLLLAGCGGVPERDALTLTAPDELVLSPYLVDDAVGV